MSLLVRERSEARLELPPLPEAAGAYRWFYVDVSAGEYSAVCIFMLGSLFSARYSVAGRRGGRPQEYCAVNFALYHRGLRRHWVLSEYPRAAVEEGHTLRIGGSWLRYEADGTVRMEVEERCAPFFSGLVQGPRVRARLVLEPLASAVEEVQLVPGLPHWWRPLAPRARARLEVDAAGLSLEGLGYHDTNHGGELLGARLPGWYWTRTHGPEETVVDYHLPEEVAPLRVVAGPLGTRCERGPLPREARPTSLTGWGLRVPARLQAGNRLLESAPRLLESSPFYARVEAREGGLDAMGEVADFRRFHSPFIRWMAHFRTRVEGTA
ncbi:MAG TPA: carotenoid 1,2-hydratase [Myxococcaceae bacterium]|nr:carotenoid 1,2-hydratase [Myxococcaceae bacterium]